MWVSNVKKVAPFPSSFCFGLLQFDKGDGLYKAGLLRSAGNCSVRFLLLVLVLVLVLVFGEGGRVGDFRIGNLDIELLIYVNC
jgi:hypothetical protein